MKFTPEEVREHLRKYTGDWPCAHGSILLDFLRSKGLLQENKPLLREWWINWMRSTGDTRLTHPHPAVDGELVLRQAALDKVRDRLLRLIRMVRENERRHGPRPCGCSPEYWLKECEEIVAEAVREGCWSPEAK